MKETWNDIDLKENIFIFLKIFIFFIVFFLVAALKWQMGVSEGIATTSR
jgi:hypothetical protein